MIIKGKNEGLGKRASEQENEPEMTEKWGRKDAKFQIIFLVQE